MCRLAATGNHTRSGACALTALVVEVAVIATEAAPAVCEGVSDTRQLAELTVATVASSALHAYADVIVAEAEATRL